MANPRMTRIALSELLAGFATRDPVPSIEIQDIASNSAAVTVNSAFIALPGIRTNGIDYAIDAVKAGAVAVIYDAADEYSLQRIALLRKQVDTCWVGVDQLDRANGHIVSRFFGNPAQAMTIVGITGTDGKSSVTHLLTQALTRIGKSCASIGTLGYGIGNQLTPDSLTTPDVVTLQSRLHQFRQQRCEYVVMEVSSHALEQYRVNGCDFDIAVLTNLGRDHLDYHGDEENYAAAKARLFHDFKLSGRVVNMDNGFGRQLSASVEREGLLRYSVESEGGIEVEVNLRSYEKTDQGQNIRAITPLGEVTAVTALLGRFNVENTLACIATLVALGLDYSQIELALKDLRPIPGRMEKFVGRAGHAPAVVDFAHTEQALRACLGAAREHTRGQLWCVFGCGGDRDQGKRPGMGRAVEELADRVIVTDDNPRNEAPEKIVAEILAGMQQPDRASVVHNRQAAIEYALSQATADDLVVIAGKGHEQEQIIGNERRPFSDRHLVSRILQVDA
ncbi:MAG TPA: UDP-N-acetylmuramoyl-L-alanyl-D-glutamate--2,6-diaminopimelate ligase [Gammaproteobacteria bacterium]|nr:UDP-N-acetylmuramoyl-L-alanyl-D-glutamate--2,6-diaminopimelate ligase [Gammaproteobacteria bacterium]